MPRRRSRLANAGAGIADASSNIFGNMLRMRMQQDISNQAATRNDQLERARTADNLIAQGKIDPEDRAAFISGSYTGPSMQDQLGAIVGNISKAPTQQEVPSRSALATDFKSKRIPLVGFGPTAVSDASTTDNLPATQFGPTESKPFADVLQTRSEKLNAFPLEKIGEETLGTGADAQPQNIYGRTSVDTGTMERRSTVPAGPTAGQKGSYEGTAQATTENLTRAGKVQTSVDTAKALQPIQIATAGGEALARQRADTKAAIERAALSGGLLPEQVQPAMQLANDFQQQSKEFFVQQDAFRKMAAQAQNPSAAGDLGIIFGYMKMLDPVSSVREGEQATAQNAAGIPDRIRNQWNKLLTGERLAPEQRNDFLTQARNIYTSAQQEHTQRTQDFTVRANQFRIPANLVVREPARGLDKIGEVRIINGQRMRVVGVDDAGNLQVKPDQ